MPSSPLASYRRFRQQSRREFAGHIRSLLQNDSVRRLDTVMQHYKYTRLRHSLDVARRSFFLARVLGWDARAVARAALLHDLFFHAEGEGPCSLLRSHPKIALENARGVCDLSPLEEDIILKHMWLLTWARPSYKESYLVTFVDKYSACAEFVRSLLTRDKIRSAYSGRRNHRAVPVPAAA